jgi:serine/threonine protein kinase
MIHNYKINTLIHNDLYGWLFNGVDVNTGINVNVWVANNERLRFTENDVVCMKMLFHRNVIQLYDVVSDDKGNVVVVKEKIPQLKLRDVVLESEMEVFKVFSQVVSAVKYMHCMGVVHLNINVDNVMVNVEYDNKVIKIGNFYYSKFINNNKNDGNIIVNEEFDNSSCVSPEIYMHLPFKPEMADVWSCGVILYYLIYKKLPFCNGGDSTINKEELIKGNVDYNSNNNIIISDEVKDLISKMLESDQHKRISLEEVIKHKWFIDNNVNNDAIIEGINWYKMKYPIDENILQLCLQYSDNVNDNNINLIKNDLLNIKYNANTALYKLCVIKHSNEQSISDLHSKAFSTYISNPQNKTQLSAEQINNIISSFTSQTYPQTSDNNNNYSSNNNELRLSKHITQTIKTIK